MRGMIGLVSRSWLLPRFFVGISATPHSVTCALAQEGMGKGGKGEGEGEGKEGGEERDFRDTNSKVKDLV